MSISPARQKLLARLGSPLKAELKLREPETRTVLEQIIYAVLREGISRDEADQAFQRLLSDHFDLNEIRVSTAREVAHSLAPLPDAFYRADRIISVLQELFETTFGFDLENIAKKGLKLAEKQLERFSGTTPFVVAFVLQNALGGHALPVDADMLRCLVRLELVPPTATVQEAQAFLEHHVPKAKGPLAFEALSAVAHEFCHNHQPRCSACPLFADCPTGPRLRAKKAPAKTAAKSGGRSPAIALVGAKKGKK